MSKISAQWSKRSYDEISKRKNELHRASKALPYWTYEDEFEYKILSSLMYVKSEAVWDKKHRAEYRKEHLLLCSEIDAALLGVAVPVEAVKAAAAVICPIIEPAVPTVVVLPEVKDIATVTEDVTAFASELEAQVTVEEAVEEVMFKGQSGVAGLMPVQRGSILDYHLHDVGTRRVPKSRTHVPSVRGRKPMIRPEHAVRSYYYWETLDVDYSDDYSDLDYQDRTDGLI